MSPRALLCAVVLCACSSPRSESTGSASAAVWSGVPALAGPRGEIAGVTLTSGKVLVSGGQDNDGYTFSTAQLFDPVAKTWSAAGSMGHLRKGHVLTLLPSGKVLATGGRGAGGNVSEAEVYDPTSNTWAAAGTALHGRTRHKAVVVGTKVLVAIGINDTDFEISEAELYDPSNNSWTKTGSLSTAGRNLGAMVALPGGSALAFGGANQTGSLSSAEIWSPGTGTFAPTGSMAVARGTVDGFVIATPTGPKVLVAGPDAGAELFDPATGTWSTAPAPPTAQKAYQGVKLVDGRVLLTGGATGTSTIVNTAVLFDPVTMSWSSDPLAGARFQHAAVALLGGGAFVAGGRSSPIGANVLSTAEILVPAPGADAGPMDTAADTWVAETAVDAPSDTNSSDSSVSDTRVSDTTVTDTDVADSNIADSNTDDTALNGEDSSPVDSSSSAVDTGVDGLACTPSEWNVDGVCRPRIPRGDAPCSVAVPGATSNLPGAALGVLALVGAITRRRRHPSPPECPLARSPELSTRTQR